MDAFPSAAAPSSGGDVWTRSRPPLRLLEVGDAFPSAAACGRVDAFPSAAAPSGGGDVWTRSRPPLRLLEVATCGRVPVRRCAFWRWRRVQAAGLDALVGWVGIGS